MLVTNMHLWAVLETHQRTAPQSAEDNMLWAVTALSCKDNMSYT